MTERKSASASVRGLLAGSLDQVAEVDIERRSNAKERFERGLPQVSLDKGNHRKREASFLCELRHGNAAFFAAFPQRGNYCRMDSSVRQEL
jgi:hypothetical protein